VQGQVRQPVKWQFAAAPVSGSEAQLIITANLDDGWHIYSQFLEEGGPLPTTFTFQPNEAYSLTGKVKEESPPVKSYDQTFMMDITWFGKTAVFTQAVKLYAPSTVIKGRVEFMVCTDEMCLPPDDIEFSIPVTVDRPALKNSTPVPGTNGTKPAEKSKQKKQRDTATTGSRPSLAGGRPSVAAVLDSGQKNSALENINIKEEAVAQKNNEQQTPVTEKTKDSKDPLETSLWSIFIVGFLGGLAAIVMPCIFPMIPFTVGYFTKRHSSKAGSIGMALLYGLSIVVIYVTVGLVITMVFGSDALNELSTNGTFNFLFFLLLVIFAASFLGAFEIALPSSWINKADAQSDRKGFAGIFFMAATLALVSFSCTGPIIGTLLVKAFAMGSFFPGPVVGMLGFSLALALPFTLFAMFPSWLKGLPKSGGWLNSVKVVLGFLELALALKFLSNVDLAYHWEWFDREVFLVLWIIIFGLMGFYLLGKLKLPHDSELKYLSPVRLFLAIATLAFSLYMIPGLWGAPLKAIAAFLPPQQTQDFDLYSKAVADQGFIATVNHPKKKYDDIFEAPYNLNAFFDYEEGTAYARKVNKPVMIDFTGHACVNCRKMETTIWSDPEVMKQLREDYVLVQLYVDDKTKLPAAEQKVSAYSGKKISTLGNKWSDLQASVFNTNAQPYYVLLDQYGSQLVPASGADYSAENFNSFLKEGLTVFKNKAYD
jgi:thiol:disulfide interchange protein